MKNISKTLKVSEASRNNTFSIVWGLHPEKQRQYILPKRGKMY